MVVTITLTSHIYRINGDFTIVYNFLLTKNHNLFFPLEVLYVINVKRMSRQSFAILSQFPKRHEKNRSTFSDQSADAMSRLTNTSPNTEAVLLKKPRGITVVEYYSNKVADLCTTIRLK